MFVPRALIPRQLRVEKVNIQYKAFTAPSLSYVIYALSYFVLMYADWNLS